MKIVVDVLSEEVASIYRRKPKYGLPEGRVVLVQRPDGAFEVAKINLQETQTYDQGAVRVIRVTESDAEGVLKRISIEMLSCQESLTMCNTRDPWKDLPPPSGRVVWVLMPDGELHWGLLQLQAMASVPIDPVPIVRACVATSALSS